MSENEKPDTPKGRILELAMAASQGQVFTPTLHSYGEPPEDHPIYAAVGRVTIAWGSYEHVLDAIIWHMMGVGDALSACLTGQMMGHAPRLYSILALIAYRGLDDSFTQRVTALQNETNGLSEKRNRATHDRWMTETKTGTQAQFKAMPKKKLTFGIEEADLDELKETLAAIGRLREKALKLLNDLRAFPEASRGTRRKPKSSPPPPKAPG